jgi:hypothetical protein
LFIPRDSWSTRLNRSSSVDAAAGGTRSADGCVVRVPEMFRRHILHFLQNRLVSVFFGLLAPQDLTRLPAVRYRVSKENEHRARKRIGSTVAETGPGYHKPGRSGHWSSS